MKEKKEKKKRINGYQVCLCNFLFLFSCSEKGKKYHYLLVERPLVYINKYSQNYNMQMTFPPYNIFLPNFSGEWVFKGVNV